MICSEIKYKEIPELLEFLKKNWGKNHILVKNKKFLLWQFYKNDKKKINGLILKKNRKIIGFQGIIDCKIKQNKKIFKGCFLCNLSISKNYRAEGLFFYLYQKLFNKNYDFYLALGINQKVIKIFKTLGFVYKGILKRYIFILNEKKFKKIFRIKSQKKIFNKTSYLNKPLNNYCKIEKINNFDNKWNKYSNKKNAQTYFIKNIKYMNWRFRDHPTIKYYSYYLTIKKKILGHIIFKQETINNTKNKIIRLIELECINDKKNYELYLINFLINFSKKNKAIFIDYYSSITEKKIAKYFLNTKKYNFAIPSLFQPLVKERRDIDVMIFDKTKKINTARLKLLKSDSDQDRSN